MCFFRENSDVRLECDSAELVVALQAVKPFDESAFFVLREPELEQGDVQRRRDERGLGKLWIVVDLELVCVVPVGEDSGLVGREEVLRQRGSEVEQTALLLRFEEDEAVQFLLSEGLERSELPLQLSPLDAVLQDTLRGSLQLLGRDGGGHLHSQDVQVDAFYVERPEVEALVRQTRQCGGLGFDQRLSDRFGQLELDHMCIVEVLVLLEVLQELAVEHAAVQVAGACAFLSSSRCGSSSSPCRPASSHSLGSEALHRVVSSSSNRFRSILYIPTRWFSCI